MQLEYPAERLKIHQEIGNGLITAVTVQFPKIHQIGRLFHRVLNTVRFEDAKMNLGENNERKNSF